MNDFLSKFLKALHHGLKLLVAVPVLCVITIAAPASTVESDPVEDDEVEVDEQTPKTMPPTFNLASDGGEPPSRLDMTLGISNSKATGDSLMKAVRNVHARKKKENLTFGQTMRELVIETSHEIPPQFEDKGIKEANEGTEDPDPETDRPVRRSSPKTKGRRPK